MIYGNTFLNYGMGNGILLVESDIQNINTLLDTNILNESVIIDKFKAAIKKIGQIITNIINAIKKIGETIFDKIIDLCVKARDAIKGRIEKLKKNESATLLESENADITLTFKSFSRKFISDFESFSGDIGKVNDGLSNELFRMMEIYDKSVKSNNMDADEFKEWMNDSKENFRKNHMSKSEALVDEMDKVFNDGDIFEEESIKVKMPNAMDNLATFVDVVSKIDGHLKKLRTDKNLIIDARRPCNRLEDNLKRIDMTLEDMSRGFRSSNRIETTRGGYGYNEPYTHTEFAEKGLESYLSDIVKENISLISKETNFFGKLINSSKDMLKFSANQYLKLCGKFGQKVDPKYYDDILDEVK